MRSKPLRYRRRAPRPGRWFCFLYLRYRTRERRQLQDLKAPHISSHRASIRPVMIVPFLSFSASAPAACCYAPFSARAMRAS